MSLSDLASLGSFVSGVAVLISLIYLALQVRQAEKNQRAALSQGYIDRITGNLRWTADANAELRVRVYAGETTFTAEELLRLRYMFRVVVVNTQDAYVQHKSGLLDTMHFDNAILGFKTMMLSQPVFRAIWMDTAPTITPEFRAVVETMLAEVPLAKPVDAVAQFNANLAKVSQHSMAG